MAWHYGASRTDRTKIVKRFRTATANLLEAVHRRKLLPTINRDIATILDRKSQRLELVRRPGKGDIRNMAVPVQESEIHFRSLIESRCMTRNQVRLSLQGLRVYQSQYLDFCRQSAHENLENRIQSRISHKEEIPYHVQLFVTSATAYQPLIFLLQQIGKKQREIGQK